MLYHFVHKDTYFVHLHDKLQKKVNETVCAFVTLTAIA